MLANGENHIEICKCIKSTHLNSYNVICQSCLNLNIWLFNFKKQQQWEPGTFLIAALELVVAGSWLLSCMGLCSFRELFPIWLQESGCRSSSGEKECSLDIKYVITNPTFWGFWSYILFKGSSDLFSSAYSLMPLFIFFQPCLEIMDL